MKNNTKILFPLRLNISNPIQTIHRKIARNLQHQFSFVAFEGRTQGEYIRNEYQDINVKTLNIRSEWPKYRKGLELFRLYLSQYDFVHTGASSLKAHPLLVRLASLQGANHIHTHHTTTPASYQQQQWLANHADIVTAVSPFVAEWSKNNFGISEVKTIPNGVDTDLFHPSQTPTEEKRALFVGRAVERKHPEMIPKLAESLPDWEFRVRMSGDGPEMDYSNITLLPRQTTPELAEEYAAATALLCPFEREGFGMVVIESMAAGTPVIGFNDGNLINLLSDTDGGILCDTLEINEWLNAISSLNADERAAAARRKAIEYEWDTITSMYGDIYKQALMDQD